MGLILYRKVDFAGGHKHVVGRDETDLTVDGWGEAKSAQILDGCWRLYADASMGGPSKDLTPGSYPDLMSEAGFRPKSVELLVPGPDPYGLSGVILHRHVQFHGAHKHIVGRDEPDLHQDGWGDEVSAIQIVAGRWRFHEHVNYGGWGVELGPGVYPVGQHGGISNDQLSSVRRVSPHWEIAPLTQPTHAILYEHHKYRGRHRHLLIGGDRNLHQSGFGDRVSSAQISEGHWHLYEHVDYGGSTAVLDATAQKDYPNPTSMAFANDTLSSVRAFVVPVLVVMVEGYTRMPQGGGAEIPGHDAIDEDLAKANEVYGARGIRIHEVGRVVAKAPDLRYFTDANCPFNPADPLPEEASLYEIGRRFFPDSAVAFYTNFWGTTSGCYSHPAGPGVTITWAGCKWTLSHEIGHMLGLGHWRDPGIEMDPYPVTNVMHFDPNAITNDPPDITDAQFATILASPYLL